MLCHIICSVIKKSNHLVFYLLNITTNLSLCISSCILDVFILFVTSKQGLVTYSFYIYNERVKKYRLKPGSKYSSILSVGPWGFSKPLSMSDFLRRKLHAFSWWSYLWFDHTLSIGTPCLLVRGRLIA